MQLANTNGQILAALTLSGSVSGTVYFWGTPTVSADGKTVSVPNLTLAAESRTALAEKNVRLPDFIANLFSKPIRDAVTLNLRKQLPQTGGTEPISFQLGQRGILSLGRLQVTIASVKSIDGELQANILIKGDPTASNP